MLMVPAKLRGRVSVTFGSGSVTSKSEIRQFLDDITKRTRTVLPLGTEVARRDICVVLRP